MREVGFKIVLDSSGLKSGTTDIKNIINDLRKLEVGFKQDGRVDRGVVRSVSNLDKMKVSLDKLMPSLERYVELMKEAVTLSIAKGGIGSGGVVNGGSRVGVSSSPGRIAASAFSGLVRRGDGFTSQIGSLVSAGGRFSSAGLLGVGAATFGGAEVIRQAVKIIEVTKEFSGVSSELAARLGSTRDGVKELTDEAIRLGDSMVYTASEIVSVQVELAKLGFSKDVIRQITGDVARFAVVSGGSIADSAKLAGATLQTFGKDASQIEDVVKLLGLSTAKTAIDFESLRQGATQLFSTAASFGLELSETLALLGALKNSGLSDSVAATATRNILLNLADDGGKLRDVLGQLGVDGVKGLDGIVGALRALDASGINLAGTFELTDKRSVNAFNTFLRGVDNLESLEKAINGTNEEFRIMERERLNSLQGDVTLFKSKVESLSLSLGVEGLARSFVQAGSSMIDFLKIIKDVFKTVKSGQEVLDEGVLSYLTLLENVNISEGERIQVISILNGVYGDYLKGVDLEKLTLADIKELKASISLEDSKKRVAINLQNEFNDALERERNLTREIVEENRKKSFKRTSTGDQDSALEFLRGRSKDGRIEKAQSQLRDALAKIKDVTTIPADQLKDIRSLSSRDDQVGAVSRDIIGRYENRLKLVLGPDLKVKTKKEALGVVVGGQVVTKSLIDERVDELKKIQKGFGSQTAIYLGIVEEIERLDGLKDKFRDGGVSPRDKRVKEKESFLDGSIKFLEERLSKEQAILDRLPQQSKNYEKQASLLVEAKEKLDIAKKKQEELTRTRREIAEDELKSGKEALDIEFRGEKGLIFEIDKKLRTTELEIAFAEKVGDSTDKLTEKLKDLKGKYSEAFQEFLRGLAVGRVESRSAERIKDIEDRGEDRILSGENPFIVDLETTIEKAKVLKEELSILRNIEVDLKKKESIDRQIKRQQKIINDSELELKIDAIEQKFVEDSLGLPSLDIAVKALESGRLDKAKQAIDIYNQEIDRLKLVKDKEIAILKGDTGRVQELDNRIKLLDLGIVEDRAKNLYQQFMNVANAVSSVVDALFELQRVNIKNDEDDALARIDKEYEARLKAAKGNAQEEERLREELERRKAAIEKKAAKERQNIAIKEAIIAAALSVVSNLKINPAAAIAAGVIGAIQIATIRKQKFAKGGYYTGAGSRLDETGEYSTGNAILHAGEYVVRRKTVEKYPEVIRALDQDRLRYASGGGLNIGVSEARISVSDMDYLVKSLTDSVSSSVYSSIMSATTRAYQESTEVLKNSRDTRLLSRRENYNLNTY